MNRFVILAAAVIMQMCLGATYSWSIYVHPLRHLTGLMQGTAQLPFTLFYFAFPATMVLAGGILPRLGPRRSAMLGGMLFGSGWLLAALGHLHFGFTALGIGILAGIGAGFAYIVPIATCIRWFPAHKGLVTGIAVAGFGGGAAVVSQIGGFLMHRLGLTPFTTFAFFGAGFLMLVTAAGAFMAHPPDSGTERQRPLALKQIIGAPPFWRLYAAMFAGLAAGFAVNANLKDLYTGGVPSSGVAAVALFALANACGRIGWGWLFDRRSAAGMIRANLMAQAVVLLASPLILRSATGLLVFAVLTGFNYGGVLVIYASSAARIWGANNVGQVYGWLFSANIPAAVAPLAAGYTYDYAGSFFPALAGVGVIMLAAAFTAARRRELSGECA
jgi:OFA family oxalate/formate antiporter-like MFS transporter